MSLQAIFAATPLIHCLTNQVVMTQTANALLAVNASPIMTDEPLEVPEITSLTQGVLINIGTMTAQTRIAMKLAVKTANQKLIPVVLDPVGIGASSFRFTFVEDLLRNTQISVLRCNQGELATIAREPWLTKGVDSGQGEFDCEVIAKRVARQYGCIVVVTGASDLVTDGDIVQLIKGGNPLITRITGTGCLLSALLAAGIASIDKKEALSTCATICEEYKAIATSIKNLGSGMIQIINGLAIRAEVEHD